MLAVIPLDGSLLAGEREISLITEVPQDTAVPDAILIVDFDNPILIAHREDEVAVTGRGNDGIAMSPVGNAVGNSVRDAGGIEMIEGRPSPNRAALGIPIDEGIASNDGAIGETRSTGESLRIVAKKNVVPVGQSQNVVVERSDLNEATPARDWLT